MVDPRLVEGIGRWCLQAGSEPLRRWPVAGYRSNSPQAMAVWREHGEAGKLVEKSLYDLCVLLYCYV